MKKGKKEEKTDYPLEDIEHLSLIISLQGEYKNLLSYLLKLESLGIYTDITSFTIRAGESSDSSSKKPTEEEIPEDVINTTLQLRAFSNE